VAQSLVLNLAVQLSNQKLHIGCRAFMVGREFLNCSEDSPLDPEVETGLHLHYSLLIVLFLSNQSRSPSVLLQGQTEKAIAKPMQNFTGSLLLRSLVVAACAPLDQVVVQVTLENLSKKLFEALGGHAFDILVFDLNSLTSLPVQSF